MAQPQASNQPFIVHDQPLWNSSNISNAGVVRDQSGGYAANFHLHIGSSGRNRSRSPATRVSESVPRRADLVEEQAAVTDALLLSASVLAVLSRYFKRKYRALFRKLRATINVLFFWRQWFSGSVASPPLPTIAAKAFAKAPAGAPARTCAKALARASAQTSAKALTMASAKASAKAPNSALAKTSAKAPARASAKTSAEAPTRASAKTRTKAPARASTKTSAKAPTRA